ncbi:MAG: hypothetical protein Kow0079_09630 [Vicingaceae bacterium]
MKILKTVVFIAIVFASIKINAQSLGDAISNGSIHGNFQLDAQYYQKDTIIGANEVPEDLLSNGFANFNYTNGKFSAGIRYESYLNPLLGFPTKYKGSGIPYKYLSFNSDELTVTVGNFYEQFGNGLIFRTYESRGLGYDNAMDGFRVRYKITDGFTVKGIIGRQRYYFELSEGIVRGIDGELLLNDLFKSWEEYKTKITVGGSFVSKYQPDQNSQFVLPENVGAYAGRFTLIRGKFILNGEYAEKINDPSNDNGFIYNQGNAAFLQTSYSTKGFGLTLSGKRIDNMSFRSDRGASLMEVQINYLPALTRQHTYNLLATLYPYATQPNGEIGFQAEMMKKFNKKTLLGGKYGTTILLNYSTAYNIDTTRLNDFDSTRIAYTSDFFKLGKEKYYEEINVEITKKFSKKLKGVFTYSNLVFNKEVVQGKPNFPMIYANIGVIDLTYKLNKKHSIRTELQGLFTHQDKQDWVTALIEYTYSPHWFIAVMDQYNYGNIDPHHRTHYYYTSMGYVKGTNRIQLGYGRQRAGIFCVGGVCRNVPAASGFTLTVSSSF